jgi:hypothetical protein
MMKWRYGELVLSVAAVIAVLLFHTAVAQSAVALETSTSTSTTTAQIAAAAAVVSAFITVLTALFNESRRRSNDRKIAQSNADLQQRLLALKGDNDIELAKISAELKVQSDLHVAEFNKAYEGRLSALAARREYEYEARKRLYHECEPLLFQLSQNARLAIGRILSLARLAREGQLDEKEGPLSRSLSDVTDPGYYIRSTLYQLLAPLAVSYILQTRLTSRDISLDHWVSRQFFLSDAVYKAFTRDFFFASQVPVISGYRETADREKVPDGIAKHYKQGIYLGRLDTAVHNLVEWQAESPQVITFGRFEQLLASTESDLARSMQSLAAIFAGFHPARRPVTWRILVAQYYIFRAIRLDRREKLEQDKHDDTIEVVKLDPMLERDLWWKENLDDEIAATLAIGHAYMARALGVRAVPPRS